MFNSFWKVVYFFIYLSYLASLRVSVVKCLFKKWISGTRAQRKGKCLAPNKSIFWDLWISILRWEESTQVCVYLAYTGRQGRLQPGITAKWYGMSSPNPKQLHHSLSSIDKAQQKETWHLPIETLIAHYQRTHTVFYTGKKRVHFDSKSDAKILQFRTFILDWQWQLPKT